MASWLHDWHPDCARARRWPALRKCASQSELLSSVAPPALALRTEIILIISVVPTERVTTTMVRVGEAIRGGAATGITELRRRVWWSLWRRVWWSLWWGLWWSLGGLLGGHGDLILIAEGKRRHDLRCTSWDLKVSGVVWVKQWCTKSARNLKRKMRSAREVPVNGTRVWKEEK